MVKVDTFDEGVRLEGSWLDAKLVLSERCTNFQIRPVSPQKFGRERKMILMV
jgi:hypothetical protein